MSPTRPVRAPGLQESRCGIGIAGPVPLTGRLTFHTFGGLPEGSHHSWRPLRPLREVSLTLEEEQRRADGLPRIQRQARALQAGLEANLAAGCCSSRDW